MEYEIIALGEDTNKINIELNKEEIKGVVKVLYN